MKKQYKPEQFAQKVEEAMPILQTAERQEMFELAWAWATKRYRGCIPPALDEQLTRMEQTYGVTRGEESYGVAR